MRNYFIQIEKEYKTLIENPNIHELSGRVGGLSRSNNELRKELDKWKKKSKRRFENLEELKRKLRAKYGGEPIQDVEFTEIDDE